MENNGAEGNWDQQVRYNSERRNPGLEEHITYRSRK